jgi:hypothetical protein
MRLFAICAALLCATPALASPVTWTTNILDVYGGVFYLELNGSFQYNGGKHPFYNVSFGLPAPGSGAYSVSYSDADIAGNSGTDLYFTQSFGTGGWTFPDRNGDSFYRPSGFTITADLGFQVYWGGYGLGLYPNGGPYVPYFTYYWDYSCDYCLYDEYDQSSDGNGDGYLTSNVATPLPAALPLFATGIGGLGLLGWRRRRRNAAAIATARKSVAQLGGYTMKMKLLSLIACMAVIGVSHASAATLVGTTSDATGIDGLVVDGVIYDVTFVHASYDTVYASTAPTFLGNFTGATDAAAALAAALNALGVETLDGIPPPNLEEAAIPYETFGVVSSGTMSECAVNGSCFWETGGVAPTNDLVYPQLDYTDFRATGTTPLPAALPLFATGLGALGLLGRRRKRKAQAIA